MYILASKFTVNTFNTQVIDFLVYFRQTRTVNTLSPINLTKGTLNMLCEAQTYLHSQVRYFYFRLGHFDYVKPEDLEKIGMGKPAIRRLIDAVKKKKASRKSRLIDKVGKICT